jgi:glutaredoxin
MPGWLFGRGEPRDVVLYTRAGCHLCDEAHDELRRAAGRYALELRVIDVDGDPALAERYGLEVPVVAIDGQVRFRGRVNRVLLERLLRAGAR